MEEKSNSWIEGKTDGTVDLSNRSGIQNEYIEETKRVPKIFVLDPTIQAIFAIDRKTL